jgi:hypothetical protein
MPLVQKSIDFLPDIMMAGFRSQQVKDVKEIG